MKNKYIMFLVIIILFIPIIKSVRSASDLVGYNGNPSYSYDIQENSVYWGDQVHMQFAVINNGADAAGAFKVNFYISTDNNMGTGDDYFLGQLNFNGVLNHNYYWGAPNHGVTITLPTCNSIGGSSPYYIGMWINPNQQVSESNYDNNKNQGPGKDYDSLNILEPLPDLIGYSGNPQYAFNITEDTAYWGDIVYLKFAVINQRGTSGPFKIRIFLSDDNIIDDGNDYLLKEINNSGLTCSQYTMYSSSIPLPSANPIGGSSPYYMGMVIDADNQVAESNEGNNKNQGTQIDYDSFTILIPTPDIQVFDSVGGASDLSVDFGDVIDDGIGNSKASQTVSITNNGKKALTVSQNGIYLTNGSHFKIENIVSSTQDIISLSASPVALAANGKETWVVSLKFDPYAIGVLNDALKVISDDPDEGTVNVALQGTGVPTPSMVISEKNLALDFDQVPNDGDGGQASTKVITLQNRGSGPLTINQGGIFLKNGNNFKIVSIMSNSDGIINLSSSSASIQEKVSETWAISILCDPVENGQITDGLTIASDDPNFQNVTITLSAFGLTSQDIAMNRASIDFGGVFADSNGNQVGIQTLMVTDSGEAPLNISPNGIYLNTGTVYTISKIISDVQGQIDISKPNSIAGNQTETWTITLQFDPSTAGQATDTLVVISNDPDENPINLPITGIGLDEAGIELIDPAEPDDDRKVNFYPTLNDGSGNKLTEQTIIVKNIGTKPLTVSQISVGTTKGYSVKSINSSVTGNIILPGAINPFSAEEWKVTIIFDPSVNGNLSDTLQIQSNDPDESTVNVLLVGEAVQPSVTLLEPAIGLGVNAQQMYTIKWNDSYTAGDARISLYLDPDTNPGNDNEILMVSNLSEDSDQNSYSWYVLPNLTGNKYYIYAVIRDSVITSGSYSTGTLLVEPNNAFHLLSPLYTSQNDYNYHYKYKGQTYGGNQTLTTGQNHIVVENDNGNGSTIKHEFYVTFYENTFDSGKYTYDEMNRVKTYTNGNGLVTNYSYDKLGNLEKLEYSTGAVVEYAYDVAGNPLSVHDTSGYIFYTYDDLDRVTSVAYSKDATLGNEDGRVISYDYDLASRLTKIVYPSGSNVVYAYDNAGRLSEVKDYTSGSLKNTTYLYNTTTGLLNQITRPNNVRTIYTYDGSARLSDLEHKDAANQLIAKYHYEYDADSRRTELWATTSLGTRKEKYTYDDLGQIIEVIYSDDETFDVNDKKINYTYDGNGNRLSMTVTVNQTVQEDYRHYYGHENRLLQMDEVLTEKSTKFYYDPAGNRIMKVTDNETVQYSYDERNLLTRIITSNKNIEFEYDAVGNRIAKTVNGLKTEYVVDSLRDISQVIEEYNNQLIAYYTYGGSRISGVLPGETNPKYYLTDGLGSVRRLVDENSTISDEYLYDIFGRVNSAPTNTNEYLFTGERFDAETGLIYLRARYYDPEVGGFITKDPMGIIGGMNSYVYVGNDPVNKIDPSGLDELETTGRPHYKWALYYGINADYEDAERAAIAAGLDLKEGIIIAPYWNEGGGLITTLQQSAIVGGRQIGLGTPTAEGMALEGAYVGTVYSFSGGSAAFQMDATAYDIQYGNWRSFGSTLGPGGRTELFGEFTHGNNLGGLICDIGTGSVPRVVDLGTDWEGNPRSGIGAAFTIKGDNIFDAVGNAVGGVFKAIGNFFVGSAEAAEISPGGVLIDKAAELIGSNLSDIKGATYDPESGQIIFLGSDNPAAVKDIDMDYFYTAVQAVYGSAVPPFVTLEPPASMLSQWVDLGDGDGIWEPGELGGFILLHNPIWVDPEDGLRIRFDMSWQGVETIFTANINATVYNRILVGGGRKFVGLTFQNWTNKPAGIDRAQEISCGFHLVVGNETLGGDYGFCLTQMHGGAGEGTAQENYYNFVLKNNGTQSYIMDSVKIIPNKQHRKYGGRVEGSKLGWVMYEADRVMKCLAVGTDNLVPGKTYNSSNVPISGFQNMAERLQGGREGGDVRMWFVPNEMTLKRHVDEETDQATIVFDKATVELKTESKMKGLPQTPIARDFADHFNEHYDEFAAMDFPVMDPDDSSGENIIEVPIFEMLREAMQSVALARFFRDNDIPLDMWWLNTWELPIAYSPKTIPTAYNEKGNILIYGGVQINKLNYYTPSADAQSIGNLVKSQRPTPTAGSDIGGQDWNIEGTSEGDLIAVAASMEATQQNSNVHLTETDLSFDSPGSFPLAFGRYYSSSYLGKSGGMGVGWRIVPLILEFSRPSWYDEQGLMRNNNSTIWKDSNSDTRLRSGEIRFINHATGSVLNFYSSLNLHYDIDGLGNPIIAVSGLNEKNLPAFTPGEWRDGSTLTQLNNSYGYLLSLPDGSSAAFDDKGKLLSITDTHNYSLAYNYNSTSGILLGIADKANQAINITYNTDARVQLVTGPYGEKVNYSYDNKGRLITVTNARSGAITAYSYNANNQLVNITQPDGITRLATEPDLRGRSAERKDKYGNTFDYSFELDSNTMSHTTAIKDTGSLSQATWTKTFDNQGRLKETNDPLGNGYEYDYYTDSNYPNNIKLPIADRAIINIDRNAYGQPTKITDPELIALGGKEVEIVYSNKTNLPLRISDSLGRVTEFTYNDNNDLIKITRYLSGQPVVINLTYKNGYLYSATDPSGKVVQIINRDKLGRVSNVTDAAGITTSYTYDSLGRLWKVNNPRLGNPIEYNYNDFDQIIQIQTPTGTTVYDYYPGTQWLRSITSPGGNAVEYVYDSKTGDLIKTKQINPVSKDVELAYSYNRVGQFADLTMPEGQNVSFEYDDLRRVTKTSNSNYSFFSLTQPDGVNDIANKYFTIRWVVDGTDPNATISLYYTTDNQGENGTLIIGGIRGDDGTDSHTWDTSNIPEGNYYIYAIVDDGVNPPLTKYTTGTVSINHASVNITLLLNKGWNLISIPLHLKNNTLPLKSIQGNYSEIFSYINGAWIELKENDAINEMNNLWINMPGSGALELEGTKIENLTLNLTKGWNLIVFPALDEKNISAYLSGANITAVFTYNSSWSSYVPDRPFNTLTKIYPGYSYWIMADENTTLTVS